jgi:hypothetical protein
MTIPTVKNGQLPRRSIRFTNASCYDRAHLSRPLDVDDNLTRHRRSGATNRIPTRATGPEKTTYCASTEEYAWTERR